MKTCSVFVRLMGVVGMASAMTVDLDANEMVKLRRAAQTASIAADRAGTIHLSTLDTTNGYWAVESSEDLVNWHQIRTIRAHDNLASYQHAGLREARARYYRLSKANTVVRVLDLPSDAESFGGFIPSYFRQRETAVFDSVSTGGSGGWAGTGSAAPQLVIRSTPTATESTPFFGDDPERDKRATVGRVLFYDKRLSANNTVSCASCHKQENAFADTGAFSDGIHGQKTLAQ